MNREDFLWSGPEREGPLLVLSHGSGAPMDSPFMNAIAEAFAQQGVRVARFEFPYMRERRERGSRRPPNRQPELLASWRAAAKALGPVERLFIGGKSLGGRMASMVADELGVAGLICMGYPFHPPGKPERTRTEHLKTLATPCLILQGSRDPFGNPEDVAGYALSSQIALHWLEDGDHGWKPRVRSGFTLEHHIQDAARRGDRFIRAVTKGL